MQGDTAFDQLWSSTMAAAQGSSDSGTRSRGERLTPFLAALPKVDLHTHLNGSISTSLLKYLSDIKFGPDSATSKAFSWADTSSSSLPSDPTERMNHCFGVFGAVYAVMDNLAFTRLAVQDVLWHYAAENTSYVELRTSLRDGMFEEATLLSQQQEGADNINNKTTHGTRTQEDYITEVRATIGALQRGAVVSLEPPFLFIPANSTDTDALRRTLDIAKQIYGPQCPFLDTTSNSGCLPKAVFHVLDPRPATVLMQRMTVRLLISVNRGHSIDSIVGTLEVANKLAIQDHSSTSPFSNSGYFNNLPFVVGLDLSGNPHSGTLSTILDTMRAYTNKSTLRLPLSMHAGEKQDPEELRLMIEYNPERWGHLVFTDEANVALLQKQAQDHAAMPDSSDTAPVALELCLTSNLITSGMDGVDNHHIDAWLDLGRLVHSDRGTADGPDAIGQVGDKRQRAAPLRGTPHVSLHTDDRGVFGCSMTSELALLSDHKALFPDGNPVMMTDREVASKLFHLQRNALEVVFAPKCDAEEREEYIAFLKARFDAQCRLPI